MLFSFNCRQVIADSDNSSLEVLAFWMAKCLKKMSQRRAYGKREKFTGVEKNSCCG